MNSKTGLVSIIILNYNGKKYLEDCLESIFRETKHDFEVIVVDNNSPDKSGDKFSKKYQNCKFILNEKNEGVSEGLNVGIKNSNGEYIVLLNNDLIVAPKWLDYLFEAYEKNGSGLYQPKFLKMSDRSIIDSAGNLINVFGFGFSREKGKKDVLKYNSIEEIGFAAGTCILIKNYLHIMKIWTWDGVQGCWVTNPSMFQNQLYTITVVHNGNGVVKNFIFLKETDGLYYYQTIILELFLNYYHLF